MKFFGTTEDKKLLMQLPVGIKVKTMKTGNDPVMIHLIGLSVPVRMSGLMVPLPNF